MPTKNKTPKIIIDYYAPDLITPNQLVAYTTAGQRLILRTGEVLPKYRTLGRLYADTRGHFFTLTKWGLRQIVFNFSQAARIPGRKSHNGIRGNLYPYLNSFGTIRCHLFVCTVFHGPRPIIPDLEKGVGIMAECDHKNGNVLDFTADNLEWVHPKENRWRADHVLKPMRKVGIDPARYTGKAMDIWFEVFRTPGAEQLTADELYRLFALLLRKKHIPETLTTLNH